MSLGYRTCQVYQVSGCRAVSGSPINDEEEEEVQVLEVVEKEQQRGKKRSGAQKRKLRMQRALAAGEKPIPRSERSQKGRAPARAAPDAGRAGPPRGGPEAPPAAGADRPEPERHAGDGDCAAPSCADVLASVRMAVVCRGYPAVKMSEEQHEALQDALLDRIELSGGAQPLQFLSTRCGDGVSYFSCANKWTAAWLEETVPDLSLAGGVRLKVGPANAVMRLAKVLVWIPKPASRKGTPELLALLQKQNIGVPAVDWKPVSRKDTDEGASLVFTVDEKSYRALRGYRFKLYLGMGQVSFKVLAKPPGFN